jgi:pimeloyl-ACP methyl ester carboxylesterase
MLTFSGVAGGCRTPPAPPTTPNATDPRWVLQHKPRADVALVFVHGIFGDTIATWTNANKMGFFSLLEGNAQVGPKVDALAFGYTSNMLAEGSLDIQEAANKLHARLQFHGVFDYPAIVFVTHSMGGLVVLRELLTHRELLAQVPGVVFYATPQEGSQITAIAQHVANNPAIEQMLPADRNGYLRVLNDEWRSLPKRPVVRCAYEKRPTFGVMIVPWESATRFCDGAPVAIDADHLSIVKPDRPEHDAMVVLINALNEFALGRTIAAKLETPDFVPEGDHVIFTMTDALGRSAARLVNIGSRALRFTLGQVSDPSLFVWPDDTPKELAGNTTERVQFGLGLGATASEYRLTLTSDGSPPLDIVVRVPNLAMVRTQQLQLAREVSRDVAALLSDPQRAAAFAAAKPDDSSVPDAVVSAVRETVAKRNPDLPESATWVLTADLMDAGNWHGLASRALRKAESISPASARAPAVQNLAGLVAAHSGDTRIFSNAPTPAADPNAADRPQPFVDATVAAQSATVADLMQRVPALKAQGLSLQGDLQRERGQIDAARKTYSDAAAIRMTPSISSRLQTVAPGAKPRAGSIVTTPPMTKKPLSPAKTTKKNPA